MSGRIDVLVLCGRVDDDRSKPAAFSTMEPCGACGMDVWVAPITFARMAAYKASRIICWDCGAPR